MKYKLLLAPLTLALALGVGCAGLLAQQRALSDKLIRFHVVANSDSEEDQNLKLAVRDALLSDVAAMSRQAETRDEMSALLQKSLPRLQSKAEKTLSLLGSSQRVEVSLQEEDFPTRYYPTFTLPAGEYLSLRAALGQEEGHNWWCVCFPSLCVSACTEDLEDIAAGAGFSEEEVDWITDEEHYVIRFRLLEWLQRLGG